MIKTIKLLALGCIQSFYAQVGINTTNPTRTLDINGNMKVSENIHLENPGVYTGTSINSYLIVKDNSDSTLKKYVPATSSYSAINSVVYFFNNGSVDGVSNYDTKISADKYYVSIGGYIVLGPNNPTVRLAGSNNDIPLYNARAFVENGTWRLVFLPNNDRKFTINSGNIPNPITTEIRLNVTVYRKNLLSIINNPIIVDMKGDISGKATATKPDNS